MVDNGSQKVIHLKHDYVSAGYRAGINLFNTEGSGILDFIASLYTDPVQSTKLEIFSIANQKI